MTDRLRKTVSGKPLFEQGDDPPEMLVVRKKPVEVRARRMREAFVCRTLEGDMQGDAGDWLIVGVAGEPYPCKPDIFDATYEVVDIGTAELGDDG